MSKIPHFIFFFGFLTFLATLPSCNNQGNDLSRESTPYVRHSGYSVGGAKDINNFRQNIENKFLPLPTDITYEGLFYDYFFDTGITEACEKLLCPSYTSAISKDPFSKKEEYFLSVGLNSGIKQEDFSRKKLNLVIVIDVSGSMGARFGTYYYDTHRNRQKERASLEKELNKTKLEAASESVVALLDHLNPEDSFGVILFSDEAYLGKPLGKVKDVNLKNIKEQILALETMGDTNMFSGMEQATKMFEDYHNRETADEVENRIIFLTDAQPNEGRITEEALLGLIKANAEEKVYISFIGIGVDFNTELIEAINKVHGANYYSVHSPLEFKRRMDDEFAFMVTPLVFDLELKVKADGFKIKKVYGSPEADEATGTIMTVATLFPSQRKDEKTRGGIVLLHLEKIPETESQTIHLTASYKDRTGKEDSSSFTFEFKQGTEFYDNTGIRKGLLLVRYANLLKNWLIHERSLKENTEKTTIIEDTATDTNISLEAHYDTEGIPIPPKELGPWERQSVALSVSEEYRKLFEQFHTYFETEMKEIEDSSLNTELKILNLLANFKPPSEPKSEPKQ